MLVLSVTVQVHEVIVVVLDHHMSLRAHLLREHVVFLRETFFEKLKRSRNL